jgi:uncharacterized membrane protein
MVTAVLTLLVASPVLQRVLVFPRTEFFTELSLLGPGHMADNYPYNITRNGVYSVFLGITNNLGSCGFYQVQVKFRNETQSAPDSLNRTNSNLPSLYNVVAFVADKESREVPVTFSFDYSSAGATRIAFNSLTVNGLNFDLTGFSSNRNLMTGVFYGNLIFELWIYNGTTNTFQYHERFVSLSLNMTE